jgi:hypothetical protein
MLITMPFGLRTPFQRLDFVKTVLNAWFFRLQKVD